MKTLIKLTLFAIALQSAQAELWEDPKIGAQLEIPEGWITLEPENENQVLHLSSPDQTIKIMLNSSSMNSAIPEREFFDRFRDQALKDTGANLLGTEPIRLDSLHGQQFQYSYSIGGVKHLALAQVIISSQRLYVLQAFSAVTDPYSDPLVGRVLGSLKIDPPLELSLSPEHLARVTVFLISISGICFLIFLIYRKAERNPH